MSTPVILIVDDTPTNVTMVEAVLATEGFRTLVADNGPAARAIARTQSPDMILLDVMMPEESGFDTCKLLKADPATADIPVLFLSALDDVKSKVTGLKIGGVDYISKPVHGEEVLARVRVHLRIRESQRQLAEQHRARLEELRNAQQAILTRPEDCPEANFSVYYRPLQETGGDFYDVVAAGTEMFNYFVADVSGHGLSAAFVTSAMKALLRQYTGPMFSPEDTMRGLDSVMRQVLGQEQYLTACYVRLNRRTRRLTVVSAGHPPVLVVRADGQVETVEMDSEPLGVFNSVAFQRRELRIGFGDRFYLYTDGMIESSPGAGRREGLEKLGAACARQRETPLAEAPERIVAELLPEVTAAQDDLLLLAAEVHR